MIVCFIQCSQIQTFAPYLEPIKSICQCICDIYYIQFWSTVLNTPPCHVLCMFLLVDPSVNGCDVIRGSLFIELLWFFINYGNKPFFTYMMYQFCNPKLTTSRQWIWKTSIHESFITGQWNTSFKQGITRIKFCSYWVISYFATSFSKWVCMWRRI